MVGSSGPGVFWKIQGEAGKAPKAFGFSIPNATCTHPRMALLLP